jgi:DNA-binding Xre family transcriptional regulator
MLVFNIRRVLAIRGIGRALDFMTKNGFTRASAVNIYNFYVSNIKVKNLEKLCRLLNCTPNDFFEWRAVENEEPIAETHALNSLRRDKTAEINNLMKEIPLEKLSEVEGFLKELRIKN